MSEEIEILNSVYDRQTVVWLLCKSPNALAKLENHIECNTLMNLFTSLTNDPISDNAILRQLCRVSLDSNQFKKQVGKYFLYNLNVAYVLFKKKLTLVTLFA